MPLLDKSIHSSIILSVFMVFLAYFILYQIVIVPIFIHFRFLPGKIYARTADLIFRPLIAEIYSEKDCLVINKLTLKIGYDCTGINYIVLVTLFILFTPMTKKLKLLGSILGAMLVFMINILRLLALTLASRIAPTKLNIIHQSWNWLTLLILCLFWHFLLSWAEKKHLDRTLL